MQESHYYRDEAARARRLARGATNRDLESLLLGMAREYEDLAEDLENGAIQIRHAELLPQRRR